MKIHGKTSEKNYRKKKVFQPTNCKSQLLVTSSVILVHFGPHNFDGTKDCKFLNNQLQLVLSLLLLVPTIWNAIVYKEEYKKKQTQVTLLKLSITSTKVIYYIALIQSMVVVCFPFSPLIK